MKLALALLTMLMASSAFAQQEYPALDGKHRAILAIGSSYEYFSATGSEPAPAFDKEFSAGAYGGWSIVPKLSAVGSLAYGFDNNFVRSTLGAGYTFFSTGFDLQARLQYEWFASGGDEPVPGIGKEFTAGLAGGYPLNHWLVAVGASNLGLDTKQLRSYLGLRAVLYQPQL